MPTPEYKSLGARLRALIQQRNEAFALQNMDLGSSEAFEIAQRLGLVGPTLESGADRPSVPGGVVATGSGGSAGRDVPLSSEISDYIEARNDQIDETFGRLTTIDPGRAFADFGAQVSTGAMEDALKLFGGGGGGGGFQPAPFQFQVLPNGDILAFDPNTASVRNVGNFPGAVQRQIIQHPRSGDLLSVNPNNPSDQQVLVENFGFPEVDPRVRFATETDLALRGLELQKRGLEIQALGQDFANQIQLGRMTYEEAQLRLNTIDSALAQRRAEREQLLQFGVTRGSITERGTTMLPGGAQLAALLTQATGQLFPSTFAELAVTNINPEGTAQDVINAGAFDSPLLGLQAGLASTRSAIQSILGAPLGNQAVNQEAASMIAEGI